MFSMFSRLALVATVAVTAACAEDLTAVNATFDTASAAWSKAIAEGKTAGADLATKGAALAVAEADATGKGLKGTFDTALADHGKVIAELEQAVSDTKAAVEKAQADKKIMPVQTAIDAGTEKFTALSTKLGAATTAAVTAFDGLKAHVDAEAAKAAVAVADPAAKDAETAKTKGGEATFAFVYTDKDAVDEAASAASLERLTKLLGSCDAIKVELTATGVEAKAKARATSLQKLMEAKAKGKIAKATGAAGDGSTKVTVATPCP